MNLDTRQFDGTIGHAADTAKREFRRISLLKNYCEKSDEIFRHDFSFCLKMESKERRKEIKKGEGELDK